jgi:NAD(P)H-hydrate epimerase
MPVPIINLAQMRAWEKATWAVGQTEEEIIRRVGKRVARRARKMTRAGDTIVILAGKGHNGEDATAAKLNLEGRKVKLVELLLPASDLIKVEMILREKPDLVIDGIFGIGLNRPLSEAWQKIIEVVNAARVPVLAVDVPSGLNAETGGHFGAVIEAQVTLTIGAPKTGMLAPEACLAVGRLETTGDVGLVPCPAKSDLYWTIPADFADYPPPRMVAAHKGNFGHAVVVAGSLGFHGAAVLAARGALRAQPGLVTVLTQREVYVPVAAQLSAAMVGVWESSASLPEKAGAVLIGPGLVLDTENDKAAEKSGLRDFLRQLWRESKSPLVVDASALDWLLSLAAETASGAAQFPAGSLRVLTPHPGEAARLLGTTAEAVQANRVQSLRDLSKKFGGCWVVLKGSQTLIGRAASELLVNSSGNPHLAQGGSGDLLGGFLTGLLAQPRLQEDPAKTISYAVWKHGAAADELQATRTHWTIEDLAAALSSEV